MDLEYIPLLQVQRDLYEIPRGTERFYEYIRTMTDETGDLELPLVAMNPMGKDHLLPFLDDLLAMDADGEAADATTMAQAALTEIPGAFRVSLVVSDDLLGGWTNRYASEFDYRFRQKPLYKRGWITSLLWTSQTYTVEEIQEETLTCIYRLAHVRQYGYPQTLAEILVQEGYAMAMAGAKTPTLDEEDLDYTREVLASYLGATLEPILIPALFGDPAAHELGYTPMGLSPRAGFALALHDFQAR